MRALKSFMLGAEELFLHREKNVFALLGGAQCPRSAGAVNT